MKLSGRAHTNRILADIRGERCIQQNKGNIPATDDKYQQGELLFAAMRYMAETPQTDYKMLHKTAQHWPFDTAWWKPKSPRRNLVKAAALIVAEIERMDREEGKAEAEYMPLEHAPVGLLVTRDGTLVVKTEYTHASGAIQAYIASTGEMFWGTKTQTPENQRKQLVKPVGLPV